MPTTTKHYHPKVATHQTKKPWHKRADQNHFPPRVCKHVLFKTGRMKLVEGHRINQDEWRVLLITTWGRSR